MLSSVARLAKVSMSVLVLCAVALRARPGQPHRARVQGRRPRVGRSGRRTEPRRPRARPRAAARRPGPEVQVRPDEDHSRARTSSTFDIQKQRPNVNGWIVGFRPGPRRRRDGKSPPVTEVHLHHAVWLVDLKPTFAAGEEKTNFNAPAGLRLALHDRSSSGDQPHDPRPRRRRRTRSTSPTRSTSSRTRRPRRRGSRRSDTQWMDVEGVKPYPVFNALQGLGQRTASSRSPTRREEPVPGRPDDRATTGSSTATRRSSTTAGHLHPGGLYTDLYLTRDGKTVRIFRSRANYFEPGGRGLLGRRDERDGAGLAGARQEGRRPQRPTRPTTRTKASWYEVMGIMVVGITNGADGRRRPVHRPRRPDRLPDPRPPAGEHRPGGHAQGRTRPQQPAAAAPRAVRRQGHHQATSPTSRAT